MGKNARLREERKQNKEAMLEQKAKAAARLRRRTITRNICISAIALAAVVGVALSIFFGVIVNQAWYLRKTPIMKTENFTIDGQMMNYFVYSTFENYNQNYGSELGINANISLKKQYFKEDVSWFEFFRLENQYNLKEVLLFAEEGKKRGITLDETEKKELSEQILSADISGYTQKFGITAEDLTRALELVTLSSKVYAEVEKELTPSDKEVQDYYAENKDYFRMVDYKLISIPYGSNGWYPTSALARAAAEKLQKATTLKEYDNLAQKMLNDVGLKAEDIKSTLEGLQVTEAYYEGEEDAVSKWAFDTARKIGDTFIVDTGTAYEAYQLTALPRIDDEVTKNVRHILFSKDTLGSDEKAKEKAEEILKKWKDGEATEDSFAKLAEEHTEDTGSKEVGGLYENVEKGEMVEPFEKWTFDANRKAGDTGIVKTDYGYHVMYFVGDGGMAWESLAADTIVGNKKIELCTEWEKTWPVKIYDARSRRLPM